MFTCLGGGKPGKVVESPPAGWRLRGQTVCLANRQTDREPVYTADMLTHISQTNMQLQLMHFWSAFYTHFTHLYVTGT